MKHNLQLHLKIIFVIFRVDLNLRPREYRGRASPLIRADEIRQEGSEPPMESAQRIGSYPTKPCKIVILGITILLFLTMMYIVARMSREFLSLFLMNHILYNWQELYYHQVVDVISCSKRTALIRIEDSRFSYGKRFFKSTSDHSVG